MSRSNPMHHDNDLHPIMQQAMAPFAPPPMSPQQAMLFALQQIERLSREADGSLVDVRAMLGDIARAAIAKATGQGVSHG